MNKFIEIKSSYPFWKHPIQWIKEKKKRKIVEIIVNHMLNSGLEEEINIDIRNLIGEKLWEELPKKK